MKKIAEYKGNPKTRDAMLVGYLAEVVQLTDEITSRARRINEIQVSLRGYYGGSEALKAQQGFVEPK